MTILDLSRRGFMIGASASAGLTISIFAACSPASEEGDVADLPPNPEVNAWVHIAPDDTVTVRVARSEMGQGTLTGLAQLVAEELECDWDKVVAEYPTPGESLARERVWRDFSTGGSFGVRGSHQYMREGGAAARVMLVEAAANAWEVPVSECTTAASVITHTPSGRTTTYGKVAAAAAELAPPIDIKLKDPSEWTIAGQSKKRIDTQDKLTGAQIYGADLTFEGMLNASIRQCPIREGKLKSYEAAAVSGMPGVRHVLAVGDNAVVVVADTWWQANEAMKALPVEWEGGVPHSSSAFDAELEDGLTSDEAFVGHAVGDANAALGNAAQVVEVRFSSPHQNHATMEPMNATALYTDESCEVWCPTQNAEAALAAVSEAVGLPIEQCDIHKVHLGGGFGRRGAQDYATLAALVAQQIPGTHVKLLWSREEDMQQGWHHPVTKGRVRGGLDADGNLTGLHLRISGQSILAGIIPGALINGMDIAQFQGLLPTGLDPRVEDQTLKYTFPNLLIDHAMRNPPVRPGFWRGVNANQNAIYLECAMDEFARVAGRDALEFRLAHLQDAPLMRAVLEAVADRGGWGKDDGKARGLCCFYSFGSYTAACAEVSVSDAGELKMHKITAATDPGTVVNPQQVEAQVQGSFVYGLSAMLHQALTFEDGETEQRNFDTYSSLRISEMPDVETIIMPSGGFFGGVGEPTIAVAAPAVLNAIYNATGKRVQNLPIGTQNLREV